MGSVLCAGRQDVMTMAALWRSGTRPELGASYPCAPRLLQRGATANVQLRRRGGLPSPRSAIQGRRGMSDITNQKSPVRDPACQADAHRSCSSGTLYKQPARGRPVAAGPYIPGVPACAP